MVSYDEQNLYLKFCPANALQTFASFNGAFWISWELQWSVHCTLHCVRCCLLAVCRLLQIYFPTDRKKKKIIVRVFLVKMLENAHREKCLTILLKIVLMMFIFKISVLLRFAQATNSHSLSELILTRSNAICACNETVKCLAHRKYHSAWGSLAISASYFTSADITDMNIHLPKRCLDQFFSPFGKAVQDWLKNFACLWNFKYVQISHLSYWKIHLWTLTRP